MAVGSSCRENLFTDASTLTLLFFLEDPKILIKCDIDLETADLLPCAGAKHIADARFS